jgi:glycosyltransferase involved in cell wall biosynthesis
MEDIPLVSVVVPLYNYMSYIGDCIRSVIEQDYDNFELIVVDDCSTDESFKTASKFSGPKIKIMKTKKNSGYSKAKNVGIIASKGEYITTLDADDMLTKNSLSARLRYMMKDNLDFTYANAVAVYGRCTLESCYAIDIANSDRFSEKSHLCNFPSVMVYPNVTDIHAQTVMMKRDMYKKYGLYDKNLRSVSDREMWWRLFGKDGKKILSIKKSHLDIVVAYYRFHNESMSFRRVNNKNAKKTAQKMLDAAYESRKDSVNSTNTSFLEL